MNAYVLWTFVATLIYWLAVAAIGNDWTRNIVAGAGIIIALATFLRYLPNAWDKYRNNKGGGEWRMLMGLELFWLGFGIREVYLMGDRLGHWEATDNPLNGFFAFWIMCAGILCFSAASETTPIPMRQNIWIIAATGLVGMLTGMLIYRLIWG